ncbi:MAG: beta-N-acetylhexosaminidase [Bacilli bacterium]|nr:beta-N-acetylhexosaminidase [Bacilli bacterium]
MEYRHFGVMLDCSRNQVMNVNSLKRFIDCLVKMGYNTLELYTEETYEVNNEPYFGYMRGRYSKEEIKEIDRYCLSKGVELIPCIQTLAHLNNLTKIPAYSGMFDINDILLIDDERTYKLIDNMFSTLAECFTTRLCNIGMDEAHMMGLGKYLDLHGFTNRTELFIKHLNKVAEIAKKYGFNCHMWSDMFFRLNNNGQYYLKDPKLPLESVNKLPDNISLTYWDYYNKDFELYDAMFAAHNKLGRPVWFAGGAWTWMGIVPKNEFSLITMEPAMKAVKKNKIENVLMTMWGDNGHECSPFSVLPSLYYIRRIADGETDVNKIKEGFEKLFGIAFDDFMKIDVVDHLPKNVKRGIVNWSNPSKPLLYNDPFIGIYDKILESKGHIPFDEYAKEVEPLTHNKDFGYIFDPIYKLALTLSVKAELGQKTRKAYDAKDKDELRRLANEDYTKCIELFKDFYKSFKARWMKDAKAFGFEIQDHRLGGTIARIESCKETLLQYVDGLIPNIDELEETQLDFWERDDDGVFFGGNQFTRFISIADI